MGAGASIEDEFRKAKEQYNIPLDLTSADLHQFDGELPPIRLIDFKNFKNHGEFPRYPDNKDIVTSLDKINRDISLIIFISHCWLRGYPGAKGWDGRPHPDNAENSKYKLCVDAIDQIKLLAPGMSECFVWLDFGCIDQDGCPAGELKQLDKIVECSDILFTPIHDEEYDWAYPFGWSNFFTEYKAKAWSDGPHAYINRGWCRVEMFYATNIPILENENPEVKRHEQFKDGLKILTQQGHRPHMLYGTKEVKDSRSPWTLQPLLNNLLLQYNPKDGNLSKQEDVVHIIRLMEELKPYIKITKTGYEGARNSAGQKHGYGKEVFVNGTVYEGEHENDTRSGRGVMLYPNGDKYEGEFKKNSFNGEGLMTYSGNGTYKGTFLNGSMWGEGTFSYPDGEVVRMVNGQPQYH